MNNKTVLCVGPHPDDVEFQCAGTLALLADKGWEVHIATMTPGDVGSAKLSREEISQIRRAEASKSAAILKGTYHCLECDDMFIMYDRETLLKATELLRKVQPSIVITSSPSDYIVDHETTSTLVRSACMAASIPNIETSGVSPCGNVPYLYYFDPIQGKDIMGNEIASSIIVDITSTFDIKKEMLCCHESQRNWLFEISKMDDYVIIMEDYARKKGREINSNYAEGFRQHLGLNYPNDNILKSELASYVDEMPISK